MEYIAIAKNIKVSPRKVRLVADSVKKQNVTAALSSLLVMNKRASLPLKKALESAIANATNNFQADKKELKIKDIIITEGLAMKRYHFAARGRVRPYKRRSSHIRVVLMDNTVRERVVKEKEVKEVVKKEVKKVTRKKEDKK